MRRAARSARAAWLAGTIGTIGAIVTVAAGAAAAPAPDDAARSIVLRVSALERAAVSTPGDSSHAEWAAAAPAQPGRRLWLAPGTPDPWNGTDKKLHAAASYGLFLSFRLAEDTSTQAALSAFSIGVLKEAHDVWLRPPGPHQGASWRDLVADAAGVAAGALAWSLLAP